MTQRENFETLPVNRIRGFSKRKFIDYPVDNENPIMIDGRLTYKINHKLRKEVLKTKNEKR